MCAVRFYFLHLSQCKACHFPTLSIAQCMSSMSIDCALRDNNIFLFGIENANVTMFQFTWKNCKCIHMNWYCVADFYLYLFWFWNENFPARPSWFVCNVIGNYELKSRILAHRKCEKLIWITYICIGTRLCIFLSNRNALRHSDVAAKMRY